MGGEELFCTEGTCVAMPGTELVVCGLGLLDREELLCIRSDVCESLPDVSCGEFLFHNLAISACTSLLAFTQEKLRTYTDHLFTEHFPSFQRRQPEDNPFSRKRQYPSFTVCRFPRNSTETVSRRHPLQTRLSGSTVVLPM